MKTLLPLLTLPLLFSWFDSLGAVRLEVHGRSRREENALTVARKKDLTFEKRSNAYADNGIGILTNSDDISYYTSLLLGGRNFTVLIDTGK